MSRQEDPQVLQQARVTDKFLQVLFNTFAALTCASLSAGIDDQVEWSDIRREIQAAAHTICEKDYRQVVNGEKDPTPLEQKFLQAGTYREACMTQIQEIPERSSIADIARSTSLITGALSVGSLGLWASHRRRYQWLDGPS